MAVNKTFVVGAAVVAVGAGALATGYYYCPWQAASALCAGDKERSGMLTESAFALRDYARLFVVLIVGGLALMAYASESATA